MRPLAQFALALSTVLLGGCLFGSPSPSPSPSAEASLPASVAPASLPPATATAVPTPGPDAIPTYTAGTTVTTAASGLRVRSGPGLSQGVLTLLPTGSNLVVELGPVRVDDWGWYLVRDADPDEPSFEEGWAAAGFAPDRLYLVPATFDLPFNPIVAGFAHEGNGEFGPVRIEDANYTVQWVASVLPGGGGCAFSADFVPGGGEPVPAIRATLGTAPAPGQLYGDFFTAHPELAGDVFLRVTSDCGWALSFVRNLPI